jgi:general stress protein 26
MESINKNQPEDNHKPLAGPEAIKKIKDLADGQSCFFCTAMATGASGAARPMSVQQVDEEGNLWFLSSRDSHKNLEITAAKPVVHLYFQGSAHSGFMHLYGTATILQDKEKIKELWQPVMKTWFTEGENDPRISVIKVTPLEGYYWDNKHGNTVAGIKMMIGAMVGKTIGDSVEGKLRV